MEICRKQRKQAKSEIDNGIWVLIENEEEGGTKQHEKWE